jgi:hypothetical protein
MRVENSNLNSIIPEPLNKKSKMRCSECNTKINITNSITCKCNRLLCYKHRYQNEHNCTFDYKTVEREILAKLNQKIDCEKIIKIN